MAVYFIRRKSGIVKIGYSQNPNQRIYSLELQIKEPLEFIRIIEDGNYTVESWFHHYFAPIRLFGEWFAYHDDMLTLPVPKLPTPEELAAETAAMDAALEAKWAAQRHAAHQRAQEKDIQWEAEKKALREARLRSVKDLMI